MDLDKKKGIKDNLIAEIGEREAEAIWNRAKDILKEIEARYPDLPKGQKMHAGYIFPSAAVQLAVKEMKGDPELGYRAISDEVFSLDDVNKAMKKVASGGSKGKTILKIS